MFMEIINKLETIDYKVIKWWLGFENDQPKAGFFKNITCYSNIADFGLKHQRQCSQT